MSDFLTEEPSPWHPGRKERRMTENIRAVDIHSHIIFKADDGTQSLEEAIDLLQLDRAEGIRTVFATPQLRDL